MASYRYLHILLVDQKHVSDRLWTECILCDTAPCGNDEDMSQTPSTGVHTSTSNLLTDMPLNWVWDT